MDLSPSRLFAVLRVLDWRGHFEMGDVDMRWLANELSVALSPSGDADLCEICDSIRPIVVRTTLGRICEECLDSLVEEANEVREILEEG